MPSLTRQVMSHVAELSEGALISPNSLLHLGSRMAVDQALSRLARKGQIMRVCQGIYVGPIQTRFGPRPPSAETVIKSLSSLWGQTIVPCGGAAAHALGLTTQVPIKPVYLTSGPNRKLKLGRLSVELHHAPKWQLAAPLRPAGEAIRALSWLGPDEVKERLGAIKGILSAEDLRELADARAVMPSWLAEPVSAMVAHG